MGSRNFINHCELQNVENDDWGLFIDIEKYENEIDSNIYKKKTFSYLRHDIESQICLQNYRYNNDKNTDNDLFYCLTNTIVTSCLTYIILCVL